MTGEKWQNSSLMTRYGIRNMKFFLTKKKELKSLDQIIIEELMRFEKEIGINPIPQGEAFFYGLIGSISKTAFEFMKYLDHNSVRSRREKLALVIQELRKAILTHDQDIITPAVQEFDSYFDNHFIREKFRDFNKLQENLYKLAPESKPN